MKKIIKLTESDLTRIVKRVIKENKVDMGILDDIDDEVAELPNDEVEDYCLRIIVHCEQIIQNIEIEEDEDYDNEEDETTIDIPSKYEGVIMELGKSANPQEIIEMYNELVEEGTPLVDYSDGTFNNEDDEEIPVDVVLDELNYAIVGEEDEDYDDEDEDF